MHLFHVTKKDNIFWSGILLILFSLGIFCIPFFKLLSGGYMGLFFINYGIAVVYFVWLWAGGQFKRGKESIHYFFLFLMLFLISAYSLNREMVIFEKATTWFAILQVVFCFNYIAFAFWTYFPRWLQHVTLFVLGISLMTFLYMSCYLAPLYLVSVPLAVFVGMSLHSFVPVLFVIYTLRLLRKAAVVNKKCIWSVGAGAGFSLAVVIAFAIQWGMIVNRIDTSYRRASVNDEEGLPLWIYVARSVPHNAVAEKVLKTGLVYSAPNYDNVFWGMPSRNFREEKKHDPLVMIATFFTGKPNLTDDDRISLLKSMYDSRYQAEERLWSDDDVYTEHINSNVRIWPQYGISYTEKVVTVSNAAISTGRGFSTQEAIYTFHLPEGAVVTSLSLWMEGKEMPGVLTTKQKASEAYRTVVGYEQRDPSVLHWQEGNTVSVRVFPVPAGQSRKFKVGITSPLNRQRGKMTYENIYFDGPSIQHTTEDITLEFQQRPQNFIAPAVFVPTGRQSFTRSGKYNPSWQIELNDQPLSTDAFCFNGKQYSVHPYQKQLAPANMKTFYLDVNASWTKDEFETVYAMVKDRPVIVYDDALALVTDENKGLIFEHLHQNQFSLFPLFLIKNKANAVLITKNGPASPNLADLSDSRFLSQLKTSLEQPTKIKLFNIGTTLSPYLKTLREYRVFQYDQGTIDELQRLVKNEVFASDIEHDGQVVVNNAEMMIVEKDCAQASVAPDHLMRLFTYNHIMQKMGPYMLTGEAETTDLVDEAQKAYVVSPVSSLVVLETQKDYERFNITDSQNSLKNASLTSKGAVPEPHEWALIAIVLIAVMVIKWNSAKKNVLS